LKRAVRPMLRLEMTHVSAPRPARATLLSRLSLLGAVAIGLVAAQPLLPGPLPRGYDAQLHLYRLVQLDHLISNGILFSRWAPDLAFGYGAPLFRNRHRIQINASRSIYGPIFLSVKIKGQYLPAIYGTLALQAE